MVEGKTEGFHHHCQVYWPIPSFAKRMKTYLVGILISNSTCWKPERLVRNVHYTWFYWNAFILGLTYLLVQTNFYTWLWFSTYSSQVRRCIPIFKRFSNFSVEQDSTVPSSRIKTCEQTPSYVNNKVWRPRNSEQEAGVAVKCRRVCKRQGWSQITIWKGL